MIVLRRSIIITIALLSATLLSTSRAAELDDIQQLTDSGKHQQAIERLQRYLLKHPDNERALFLQALNQHKLGKDQQALENYEALTRSHPDSPEAWNNLAVLYAASGEHNKARDALLSAINTHPSYATAYENLGNIYAKMAVSAYNRALETGKREKAGPITLASISDIPGGSASTIPPANVAAIAVPPPVTETRQDRDDKIRTIIDTVNGWLNAWSAQNVEGYLAYYANDFKPANGLSRSRWQNQRRNRLLGPQFIKLSINNPDVFLVDSESARFSFDQTYKSDQYSDVTRKTLMLKKINGQWQILREYTEG